MLDGAGLRRTSGCGTVPTAMLWSSLGSVAGWISARTYRRDGDHHRRAAVLHRSPRWRDLPVPAAAPRRAGRDEATAVAQAANHRYERLGFEARDTNVHRYEL
ncbi:MAG: hypothetical protein ACR2KK_20790 [Acidimicrobiales bacterium]